MEEIMNPYQTIKHMDEEELASYKDFLDLMEDIEEEEMEEALYQWDLLQEAHKMEEEEG